jgi:hypothetical protein
MRVRSRKYFPLKTILILVFSIIPIGYLGYYSVQINTIYTDLVQATRMYEPDANTYVDINYSRLDDMVYWTDERFQQFHMPLNMSSACTFVDDGNFDTVSYYHYSDNEALFTGTAYAGWVHKYLAGVREDNETIIEDALSVINSLTTGLAMLIIVPNGGLGSEFSGILARGYAPPDEPIVGKFYFDEDSRHFNGTYPYDQYRWRGYTSNDEFGGYYMALALATKYIAGGTGEIHQYVNYTVGKIVDQLANYMLKTNFLGIHATGSPTGVDQKPRFGSFGFWAPLLLKMASIYFPEKYERQYYHWVTSELAYMNANEGNPMEIVNNYYAYSFTHDVIWGFLLLEGTQSAIGNYYYNKYINSMWSVVSNHRNAYFNAIYLSIQAENGSIRGDFPLIEYALEDQLMRMDINHFPDRYNGHLEIDDNYTINPAIAKWSAYVTQHPDKIWFTLAFGDIQWGLNYYIEPMSVEYRPASTFLWERTPFYLYWDSSEYINYNDEQAGMSLTVPYWIARAHGFIVNTGMKINGGDW